MTQILNIAGYKFTPITELEPLRSGFLQLCESLHLKGTILLSEEGINISLAGVEDNIGAFKTHLKNDMRFADISFHQTYSEQCPFQRLKVKLKSEIITLRKPEAVPLATRAPALQPEEFKQWLDENRDITILDTRNDYEVRFGTFKNAINPQIADFGEFPEVINTIDPEKPVVMFCTGGIRCEKAALLMLDQGCKHVYQLEGGILGYFAKVGGAYYDGECFVFDERVAVNPDLKPSGTAQCHACQGPVTLAEQQLSSYVVGTSCPKCFK